MPIPLVTPSVRGQRVVRGGILARRAVLCALTGLLLAAMPAHAAPGWSIATSRVSPLPRATPEFLFGINAVDPTGQTSLSAADVSYLGASVARVEVASTASVAAIRPIKQAFDAKGIEIILLASRPTPAVVVDPLWDAGPLPEHAPNLAAWAKAFGPTGSEAGSHPVRQIEFGNENGFNYPPKIGHDGGEIYASNYRAAYDAINGPEGNTNVGLLAQGDAAHGWVPKWVTDMFQEEPGLATLVADNGGWVAHPYGPNWKQKLDTIVDATAGQSAPSSIPIFITEWGLASTSNGRLLTGNYGWAPDMDYQEAAAALRSTVQAMRADDELGVRITRFMLYQQHDQKGEPGDGNTPTVTSEREHYFGALKTWYYGLSRDARLGQRDKGAYTTEVKRQTGGGVPELPILPTVTTPPPPPVPPPPSDTASFAGSPKSLRVSKTGSFKYSLVATPLRSGKLSLRTTKKITIGSKKGFMKLAPRAFTASSTGKVNLRIKLWRTNLKMLKSARQLRFIVTATLAGKTFTTKLTLHAPKRS